MAEHDGERRLYGTVGAETLWFSPAEVYENDIAPWLTEIPPTEHPRREIEEHDTYPGQEHLPSADSLLDWVAEWAGEYGELDETGSERFGDATSADDVKVAAQALIDLIASKVDYRMAKDHLRSLWLTWDAEGHPLLDGERLSLNGGIGTDDQGDGRRGDGTPC
jgi:hypothetical protein